MKAIYLTGQVIRPQILISTDCKRRAVDFLKIIKNGCGCPKSMAFKIIGHDTEYTTVEEFSKSEFSVVCGALFAKLRFDRFYRKKK